MTNRERDSVIVSSVRVGRCAMSIVVLLQVLRHPPYDAVRWWCRRGGHLSARPAVVQSSVVLSAPCRVPPRPGSHPELAKGGEDGVFTERWGAGGPSVTWSRAPRSAAPGPG